MRPHGRSRDLSTRATEYSLARTLLVAAVASLAVVGGALAVMYPAVALVVAAGAVTALAVTAVGGRPRISLTRRDGRRTLVVDFPFGVVRLDV